MTQVADLALKELHDEPVLFVNQAPLVGDARDLTGRFGFASKKRNRSGVVLDKELTAMIAFLALERRRHSLTPGWVEAAQIAGRLPLRRTTAETVSKFLGARLEPYVLDGIEGETEFEEGASLPDESVPRTHLVQYAPLRAVYDRTDRTTRKANGRWRGPYRAGPEPARIRLNRRALLRLIGLEAIGLDGDAEAVFKDEAPKLKHQGRLEEALCLFEAYLGRRRSTDRTYELQQIELLIGYADVAIELGKTTAGIHVARAARGLARKHSQHYAELRTMRLLSLLHGQANDSRRAIQSIHGHEKVLAACSDDVRKTTEGGWHLTTEAQAYTKIENYEAADKLFRRAAEVVTGGNDDHPLDRPLLAVVHARRAENAWRMAQRVLPHRRLRWLDIARDNVMSAADYEGYLPIYWQTLVHRLRSRTFLELGQYETASTVAMSGLALARSLGMEHEEILLRELLEKVELSRTASAIRIR